MKILYYSCLPEYAPETSYYEVFAQVARYYGHDAELIFHPKDLKPCDFVFSTHMAQPKITPDIWVGNFQTCGKMAASKPQYLMGVRSWDNICSTIPETKDWVESFWEVADDLRARRCKPVHFALAKRKGDYLDEPAPDQTLVYCGVNWDHRYLKLLTILTEKLGDRFSIYGPHDNWVKFGLTSYKGYAKDIVDIYRKHSAVLVLHNPLHLQYDVITDRIHDAVLAGAIPLAPLTKNTLKSYGGHPLYFDPQETEDVQAEKIIKLLERVPTRYSERQTAFEVFNERFSMDALFPNLIEGVKSLKEMK